MYTLLLSCMYMYVCDQSSHRQPIELFTTVSLIYGCFFPRDLVTSHFINLHLTMVFQYLKSTLHALVIAMSDKPRTSYVKMHKISEPVYSYLVLASVVHHLLVHDLIHKLESLQSLLLRDADVLLLQRHGTEAVVEKEEPLVGPHPHESRHVLVVWKRGAQANQSHVFLRGLNITDGPVVVM